MARGIPHLVLLITIAGILMPLWSLVQYVHENAVSATLLSDLPHEKMLERIQAVESSSGSSAELFALAATTLRQIGVGESKAETRITYLCRALSLYGRSLSFDPYNAASMVHWANLRQLLADTPCRESATEGGYRLVLDAALRQDPTNTRVLYASALVRAWGGDRDDADKILHSLLELAPSLTENQREYILSRIDSPQAVKNIIPAQFPQVLNWIDLMKRKEGERYVKLQEALGELQREALRWLLHRVQNGEISRDLAHTWLEALFGETTSEPARQMLDLVYARTLEQEGDKNLAQYLLLRAQMNEVPIVRSTLEGDTRPLKTSLGDWGKEITVSLDDFYRTIGFYAPDGAIIKSIRFLPSRESPPLELLRLRVLVSQDNEEWTDVTDHVDITQSHVGHRSIVLIFPRQSSRYWKIHYSAPQREKRFVGVLSEIVRAYGVAHPALRGKDSWQGDNH